MSATPHILICDDDPIVHESLRLYFENEHYTHSDAFDGDESLQLAREDSPDLILLDVMMPKMNGLDVCRELRKTMKTPIIILTAKGEEIDRVLGLELGADDYIVKPFSPREVVARIKAVLRRTESVQEQAGSSQVLRFDGLEINIENYSVKVNTKTIPFTPKEVEILHLLASHPGTVMNREQILRSVWGNDFDGDLRTIDTHIKRIRQKITYDGSRWNISTVYGVGYKFEVS
ncbi:MAG: response regulator transcription factor [Clostridiales bacterium]|jgi:DNA-binding response OmpR family regulator|nr:response regulator transcription factor [Clostridiales bacterium]